MVCLNSEYHNLYAFQRLEKASFNFSVQIPFVRAHAHVQNLKRNEKKKIFAYRNCFLSREDLTKKITNKRHGEDGKEENGGERGRECRGGSYHSVPLPHLNGYVVIPKITLWAGFPPSFQGRFMTAHNRVVTARQTPVKVTTVIRDIKQLRNMYTYVSMFRRDVE